MIGPEKAKTKENLVKRKHLYDYELPKSDIYDKVADEILTHDPLSVLEIGCGDGEFLISLREKNYKGPLTGIDVSKELIEEANKIKSGKDIFFQVLDAHNMSFVDAHFDIVVANFTLHTFRNMQQALDEINRVLKPEGYFMGAAHGRGHLPKRRKFTQMVAELLPNVNSNNTLGRVMLENLPTILTMFEPPITDQHIGEIKLYKPDVYIEYFDTLKDYAFFPQPNDELWHEALKVIEKQILEEIEANGYFSETTHYGMFKSQKPY